MDRLSNWDHFIIIPSIKKYFDRLNMFLELGKYFDRQELFIQGNEIYLRRLKNKYHNTNFRIYKDSKFRINKLINIYRFLQRIDRKKPTIIHDLFIPNLSLIDHFQVWNNSKNIYYFISLYFPSTKFFRTKGWENLQYCISKLERKKYRNLFFKRSYMEYISTKLNSGIIGNSKEICESITHYYGYPSNRVTVIPTAINTNNFYRVPKARERLSLPLKKDEKLILYVGSIQPRKEVELLVEMAVKLNKEYNKNVKFIICGSYHTNRRKIINNLIKENDMENKIHFIGYIDQTKLPVYYSAADCLVFPSRWEGSPRVIKEAMACGCPVIATDISGNRAIDPKNRWINYFTPGNIEEAVNAVLNSFRVEIDRKAQISYVNKNFSPTKIAKIINNFYNYIVML